MCIRTFGLLCTALAVAAFPVQARETEELIVSVRKSDENIQQVPVQVTAFTDQIIRSEAVRDIGDVAELTPSLQFDQGFWASDTRITIRGLFQRAGRPSAAVLIDGIDAISESFESTGGSALLNQRLLDIERIEVARGPQSALYGRAAFAGGINYVTRRPPEEFEATADGQVADGGRFEMRGSVGGALIEDKLTAKVIGSHYEIEGDYTNPNTAEKVGGGESDGIGIAFNWTPSDTFSAYWNNTYTKDEFGPQAIAFIAADTFRVVQNIGMNGNLIPDGMPTTPSDFASAGCDPARVNPARPEVSGDSCLWSVTGKIRAGESDIDAAPDPRSSPGNPRNFPGTSDRTLRSNLILDFDINDNLAFRSATGFTDATQRINFDSTQTARIPGPAESFGTTAGNLADSRNEFQIQQIYQEFQLKGSTESTNWLLGVNAFLEDGSDLNTSRFWYRNPASPFCFSPTTPCSFRAAPVFNKTISRDTESYSLFGLWAWQFADMWKFTFEGRWIYDDVEISVDTSDLASEGLVPPFMYAGKPGFQDSVSDTNFVPRFTLEFIPNDQLMVYASAANGIKPPTYNTTDLNDPEVARVAKEKLWTYEIGAKSTLSDGKLLLNGAVFYNDYRDQQVRVQLPPAPPSTIPRSGVINAAEVTVWGVEVDASWLPTDRLSFNFSYAYTNGEYDDFNLRAIQDAVLPNVPLSRSEIARAGNLNADFSGNDTPGNPEHAASLLGRYQAPLSGTLDWYGQAVVTYQGERFADKDNLVILEDYALVNGQIGLQTETWFVSLFADNLFDDDTIRYAQTFIDQAQGFQFGTVTYPNGYFAYLPQPRTVGLRFAVRTP